MNDYDNDYNNLEKLIEDWYKIDIKEKTDLNIKEDISKFKYKYDKNYYKEKIFYSIDENTLNNLSLSIEICDGNSDLIDIWNYLHFVTSSNSVNEYNNRSIKILLKDNNTEKYLGLLQLTSDFYSLKDRDDYIGWTHVIKRKNLKYIVCLMSCKGLQPIAHNLNIGKLLSLIAFSKEVMQYFYNKYGYYYVAVSTTSLYGKSIQYDRLKELKLIGYTKGYGTIHIPDYLYEEMILFFKKYYQNEYNKFTNQNKLRKISFISKIFGYSHDLLYHGQKRGIYFGYINNKSKDYLNSKINEFDISNVKSLNDIIEWWKDRWAKKRWDNLYNSKLLKLKYELKNMTKEELFNEYIKQYNYYKYHHDIEFKNKLKNNQKKYYLKNRKLKNKIEISKNKRNLDFIEIIEIIEWKLKKINGEKFIDSKIISQIKLSEYFSQKFNKNISEQMIKYYWNGKVKLHEDEFIEYYNENYIEHYNKYINIIQK